MLVYMCACRLRLCVRSGLRLRLTHHLSRPPPPPPCSAGGGCLRCVGDFSRRGRMLGRAPAHSRRSIGGAWPYWPCWAPIGGGGAFGSPGPGPGPPWLVGCRWSLRACRNGTLGRLHCGLSEVPPSGSPLPFLGGGRSCPCGWFSWGSRALGGLRMFGARVFSVPASCLAGWGCCPHTHY